MEPREHLTRIDELFTRACLILKVSGLAWRPMQGRTAPLNTAKNYSLAYTNLRTGLITLDIFTPRRRQPKSFNGLLRVLAHEIAHRQKPPYRQRYRGRWITRTHFPKFYTQVNKNIERFKADPILGSYFEKL